MELASVALSPVHTGDKVEFNTVDLVKPATNRQHSWTFNFVAGLFGNNLNIYESRDDPVTSHKEEEKKERRMGKGGREKEGRTGKG